MPATAAEARDRYAAFLARDGIVQGTWHSTASDGRELACALGVIGPEISSPKDCPAHVMPRWLAQMVPWLFDNQQRKDALDWGSRFYDQIARLEGVVPFSVIHDWQGNVVGDLAIEVATKRNRQVEPHQALKEMHIASLAGKSFTVEEWRPVLKDADADAYADADADAYAYADADADAYVYAYADAYVYAYADADADAIKRLADGLVDCLARVPVSTLIP